MTPSNERSLSDLALPFTMLSVSEKILSRRIPTQYSDSCNDHSAYSRRVVKRAHLACLRGPALPGRMAMLDRIMVLGHHRALPAQIH